MVAQTIYLKDDNGANKSVTCGRLSPVQKFAW